MAEAVQVVDEHPSRLAEVEVEHVEAVGVAGQADEAPGWRAARRESSRGSACVTSSSTTPSTWFDDVMRRTAAAPSASLTNSTS